MHAVIIRSNINAQDNHADGCSLSCVHMQSIEKTSIVLRQIVLSRESS